MVYLLHFNKPLKHARPPRRGSTDDLADRLNRHRYGNGARLIEVITQAGIGFQLARTLERWASRRTPAQAAQERAEALSDLQIASIKDPPRRKIGRGGRRVTQ